MEGATSTITNLGDGWVKKTLKRRVKKTNVMPMAKQVFIQAWSAATLKPENGFKRLFTPEAKAANSANSYLMKKINVSNPVESITDPELIAELVKYFSLAKRSGYYPSDFELYTQPDGMVALVDFDKYGTIDADGKHVTFPFRGRVALNTVPMEAMYSEELSLKIKNIMKGGSRKTRKFRRAFAKSS